MASFDPRLVQYDGTQTQRFYKLLTETTVEGSAGSAKRGGHAEYTAGLRGLGQSGVRARWISDATRPPEFYVDHGYGERRIFATMGLAILSGREFLTSDTAEAPRVAVVNEQFAKHYWSGANVVGKAYPAR